MLPMKNLLKFKLKMVLSITKDQKLPMGLNKGNSKLHLPKVKLTIQSSKPSLCIKEASKVLSILSRDKQGIVHSTQKKLGKQTGTLESKAIK